MTPRRLLLAAPAALAAAAAAVLLPLGGSATAVPAAAGPIPAGCGALDVTDTEAVAANAEGVSDVFLGRVVRLDRVRVNPGASAGATSGTESPATQDLVYNVLVDVPITGGLAADRRVDVVLVGVESGDEPLRRSRRYLFFATGEGSVLRADGCDGYASGTMLDAATLEEIRTALTAEPETPDAVLTKPEGSDGPPDLGRVVAPGAAVSLIGILGLLLVSRVGRNRG